MSLMTIDIKQKQYLDIEYVYFLSFKCSELDGK